MVRALPCPALLRQSAIFVVQCELTAELLDHATPQGWLACPSFYLSHGLACNCCIKPGQSYKSMWLIMTSMNSACNNHLQIICSVAHPVDITPYSCKQALEMPGFSVNHQEMAGILLLMYKHCNHCGRINNAGSNGYKYGVLGDYTDAELVNIVETNVLGVMLGCREVLHNALTIYMHWLNSPLLPSPCCLVCLLNPSCCICLYHCWPQSRAYHNSQSSPLWLQILLSYTPCKRACFCLMK